MAKIAAPLAALMLTRSILAAQPSLLPGKTGFDEILPYDLESAFAIAPNGTGSVSIPGFDLSQPWEGKDGEASDDWDIFMTVHANYEPAKYENISNVDVPEKERGLLESPIEWYIRVPEDSFESDEMDDNWSVCAWYFSDAISSIEEIKTLQDEDDDRECAGVIDDDCIEEALSVADDLGDCTNTPSISCGVFGKIRITVMDTPENMTDVFRQAVSNDNGSSIAISSQLFPYARASDAKSVDEAYDEALTMAGAIIVSYKYRDGGDTKSRSFLRCPRVDKVAEGSEEADGFGNRLESEDAGSFMAPPLTVSLMIAVAVFVWM